MYKERIVNSLFGETIEKKMSFIKEKKSIKLYYDGSIYPRNPGGTMGMGVVIYNLDNEIIHTLSETVPANPENTCNIAECLNTCQIDTQTCFEHRRLHKA